jgi:hypothetical protein
MAHVTLSRAKLATEVYEVVRRETESFGEDYIGEDLAYLMGAILKDEKSNWPSTRPLVRLLKTVYTEHHSVWEYIEIED